MIWGDIYIYIYVCVCIRLGIILISINSMISILVYNALSYVGGIKCVMPLIFLRLIRELGEIGA